MLQLIPLRSGSTAIIRPHCQEKDSFPACWAVRLEHSAWNDLQLAKFVIFVQVAAICNNSTRWEMFMQPHKCKAQL